jgi:hypothetical protein
LENIPSVPGRPVTPDHSPSSGVVSIQLLDGLTIRS